MITGMSKDGKPSEDSCGVEVNTIKALEAKVKASGDDDAMGLVALLRTPGGHRGVPHRSDVSRYFMPSSLAPLQPTLYLAPRS